MASIWETSCQCGNTARVELVGEPGNQTVRVGCEDHWFELPAQALSAELAKLESATREGTEGSGQSE
ncbi:MAG: hypothetical protein IH956_03535 [Chloroflexi bacterium]|nr:hypothetical protein [Chloroflexota bacterium]